MIVIQSQPVRPQLRARRKRLRSPYKWGALMLLWIVVWTIIFSGVDFWTLKLYDISHKSWFQTYRAIMRNGISWVSPPSFALAENAYFLWVNMYDGGYTMHEWDFYTGNPLNPDGKFNFVWGDNHGGWIKFPMLEWYGGWLIPTIPWFIIVALILSGRWTPPGLATVARFIPFRARPELSQIE